MTDGFEQRLAAVEDRLAINQLFIDYGRCLDEGRFDDYAGLFAVDGVLRLGPIGTAVGRDAIRELMAATLEGRVGETVHIISSPVVTLDGDTATAVVMWTAIGTGDGGTNGGRPELVMVGQHEDRLVREDGAWRFAERRGHIDMPATYPGG